MKDLVSVHEDKIVDFGIKAFRVVKNCCLPFWLLLKHSEPHLDYACLDSQELSKLHTGSRNSDPTFQRFAQTHL